MYSRIDSMTARQRKVKGKEQPMARITLRIPREMHKRWRQAAIDAETTMQTAIVAAYEASLLRRKGAA